jgi:DNA-binding NarL/FixJ family response regulator
VNIHVLIIDAIRLTGLGTATVLRHQAQMRAYHAATLTAAIWVARLIKPHVILLEPYRLDTQGIEAVQLIERTKPDSSVLLFTELRDRCLIQDIIRAGAAGYIGKRSPIETLIHTVRTAYHDRFA